MILKKYIVTALALMACGLWFPGKVWAIKSFTGNHISKEAIIEGLIPHYVASKHATSTTDVPRTRGISHLSKIHTDQQSGPNMKTHALVEERPAVALELHFSLDSATLTPEAIAMLNELARALEDERLNKYKFSIEGHTCDLGSAVHNLDLSRRRAYAVAEWLTSFSSLSPDQFEVRWFGESCPLVPNTNEKNRRKNRRVVIRNTLEQPKITVENRPATLQIIRNRGKKQEIIADGDTLTSNDPYSLVFKTAEKPYVYICQADSRGTVQLVFPNTKYSKQKNPVVPGSSYAIPEQPGTGLVLDNTLGTEQLILLAMSKALADPRSVCETMFVQNAISPAETGHERGVGGIAEFSPEQKKRPISAILGDMQLCEVVAGGKLHRLVHPRHAGAKRGIGGIAKIEDDSNLSTAEKSSIQESTCQGIFLKRFFIHK